ncbi:vacuolar ATPase assembly integral membrane protein VMA21 [Aspergillus fischeri NRRL 181]|uniref:Vacuolar ATPase assembly integral membrane protein vma21 n=1 Tax=Neosartorya fischeri (strain ATCC 1020 / DSM 3700 / CBS 544.65 / FGSC A1164 / JCM 1740 / NRRL 181 / WB 181) TaxID=331117 RepID=VMA21_NEOFI|nr:conserved hypothetical protein [Aspergillus fischeri NRRL 181]A1D7K7.1 RecName: Full=Vacuolar ATPase assembly integral membrane protein vma21 [Aspergillus fischeri NRRL 181]EAW21701.1 conserved hypothetical protein [Aspergillus fischeri NRRL 181]KAG2024778.1 hypothetical protein GB937_003478 [Aspergillus fischeri]
MTSRRSQEKSYAEAAAAPPPKEAASSDVTPAVPADVIYKLLGFTAAMVVGPIGMYFITVNSGASSTVAGITAAITANLVLFGYIYVAWLDDREEREAASKKKEKKAQ